jgi:hypothetical protein
MAVVQGNKALASDYNTLRTEVNRWFADNYAGSISFGNSNQTYGWGGSAVPAVNQGDAMLASQMNALIDRCNIGEDICNSVSGQLSQIVAGNNILASEFNAIETKSDSITTNRLSIESAELSIGTAGNIQRSTTWSAAINCTVRYTFTSFDKARYFFNAGGAIMTYGSISGYSTGTGWDGAGFNQIFTNLGTVSMNYTQTTQTGSGGTPSVIGYYDLTTSFANIFIQTGTGAYSDAVLTVAARRSSSGNWVEMRVTLTPGAGRSVNGTTVITSQRRLLNGQSSGAASLTITAPTYSVTDPLI